MINAKIIGAGGYGGVGLAELLYSHPEAEIGALVDIENSGVSLSSIYPHLAGMVDDVIIDPSAPEAGEKYDVVFMATPDGVGMKLAAAEVEKGAKVIDFSGDFRFNTEESYAEYASRIGRNTEHASPDLLKNAVYGVPELHRQDITPDTSVVGNPGCFAVSCILGLSPAIREGLIDTQTIICDCKTGISGAGKKPSPAFHYPARYDNMNAYKLAGHQHVCEIERELGLLAGNEIQVTFTSQVVPACRGIMSTLYGKLNDPMKEDELIDLYSRFYSDSMFIRVLPSTASAGTSSVRETNYCNLVISCDPRTGTMRIVSYIDNLVKGQAGSAVQNMNLLFGLNEGTGLDRPGRCP